MRHSLEYMCVKSKQRRERRNDMIEHVFISNIWKTTRSDNPHFGKITDIHCMVSISLKRNSYLTLEYNKLKDLTNNAD